MNPEVKAAWVTALRSGEYKQGYGKLSGTEGHHCCLGVLCDLALKSGEVPMDIEVTETRVRYDKESAYPPKAVQRWAGIPENPFVGELSLSLRNDQGVPFDEIADLIERAL